MMWSGFEPTAFNREIDAKQLKTINSHKSTFIVALEMVHFEENRI